MLRVIRSLADDCRAERDHQMADGFTLLANDVEELVAAVVAERQASDSGDTIAQLEARLRVTQSLLNFTTVANIKGPQS